MILGFKGNHVTRGKLGQENSPVHIDKLFCQYQWKHYEELRTSRLTVAITKQTCSRAGGATTAAPAIAVVIFSVSKFLTATTDYNFYKQ